MLLDSKIPWLHAQFARDDWHHLLLSDGNNDGVGWEVYPDEVPPTSTSHIVSNLRPSRYYRFRISAVNTVGEGNASQPMPNPAIKMPTQREYIAVVSRSLRHYLQAQSLGHHTIGYLEERGIERRSARQSSSKGRERAIVSQRNTGTISKATLRNWMERIWAFPSA